MRQLNTVTPIDEAIAFLRSSDNQNIAKVARTFGVKQSTLSKCFRSKTGSIPQRLEQRQLLNNTQEARLVKQI